MDTVTMRLRWYSWPSLTPAVGAIAACIGIGFISYSFFGLAAIFAVLWFITWFGGKIEVTSTDVKVRIWGGYPRYSRMALRTFRESARRDAIHAMHWYGGGLTDSLTFEDEGHWVLMGFPIEGWTRGQLLDLSEMLGVPLYDHRTKHGWGKDAWDGQLVQRRPRTSPETSSRSWSRLMLKSMSMSLADCPCLVPETGREPLALSGTRTTSRPALTSITFGRRLTLGLGQ